MSLSAIATTVTGDEKAYAYQEVNLQSPGNRGFHRYRIILVNRDGNIAEFRQDMGPIDQWVGTRQINIPSFWEHTVDELRDLGENLRYETKIDVFDWLELDKAKIK
jgi:hypothetical protein